ncbi:hypothetical protein AAL_08346 [Moelleriella libera RCEF 2490]|uniref:Uncharacterized protein n=1 Tax=Moelleriella libera RCEF 2490 TaxID=1081109 RepID=A0A167VKY0_9HYPO|nr:hypothetical protein AAL_08346 [Moelleriella libera RCEF 2490]
MWKEASVWTIVHAAVSGFMLMPILTVGLLTLFLARRRQDPARPAFLWLKFCHPSLVVSLTCIITADILNVVLFSWQNDAGYYDTSNHTHDDISSLIRSERYLSFTGNLFEHFVDVLLVLVFSELGSGLMYTLDRHPSPYQRKIRYLAYIIAVVLLSLAFAYFAQPTNSWIAYWNGAESNSSYAQLTQSLTVVGKLGASFYIPSWIVSICQLSYASFVMHKHKGHGLPTRHVALLYVTITALDLVRWTLFLVLYATWILPEADNPFWWNLVEALGNTWIRFTQLMLLLIIGMRRKKGIWTTHQSWMRKGELNDIAEMASTTTSGPSPVMAAGTVYHQSPYLHKEYNTVPAPPPIQPTWYMPSQVPAWQHPELVTPQPVIIAPRELEPLQYTRSLRFSISCKDNRSHRKNRQSRNTTYTTLGLFILSRTNCGINNPSNTHNIIHSSSSE